MGRRILKRVAFEMTPEMDGDELAAVVAKHLSHKWEDNGIGGYEFWGQKGTHHEWVAYLYPDEIWIRVPASVGSIPVRGKSTYQGGGCPDGQHHCTRECREVELSFVIDLQRAEPEGNLEGALLVRYAILTRE